MTKVINIRSSNGQIYTYCGRPGPYGNKYSSKPSKVPGTVIVSTKEEAILQFTQDLLKDEVRLKDIRTMEGLTLGCFCVNEYTRGKLVCHAQVLAYIADNYNGEPLDINDVLVGASEY